MNCFEAKDGEDDRAGVDGGEGIAGGDDDHVLDAVLRRVVVAAEADDGAKSEAEGVKDLGGCVVRTRGLSVGKTFIRFASSWCLFHNVEPDLQRQAKLWAATVCPSWG